MCVNKLSVHCAEDVGIQERFVAGGFDVRKRRMAIGLAVATFALLICGALAAAAQREAGLVLHYDFNEGSGTVARDKSGRGLDGGILNGKYIAQATGFALAFNQTACVQIPQSKILDAFGKPGRSYSIELWFASPGALDQSLTEKWHVGDRSYPWAIRGPSGTGFVAFALYDTRERRECQATVTDASLKDNKWHQLVGVRDAEGNRVKLYIDGVLRQDVPDVLKDVDISNEGPICIGARRASRQVEYGGFIGQMDEVRIYSRALTPAQVQAHYKALRGSFKTPPMPKVVALPPPLKEPVAQWDFDEGSGNVARDSSGSGNHGTVHGGEWVRLKKGHALKFDGMDDYVNCGRGASLDIRGPVTLEAWINPLSKPTGETGIIGKSFDSYLLTYYGDDNCWWYIAGGTNHTKAHLMQKEWQHVAVTFDGAIMASYVNGRLTGRQQSRFPAPQTGKDFLIGCAIPDLAADDPAYAKVGFFKGIVDAVRVYNRALAIDEIATHYVKHAADYGIDTTWFNRLRLTPYFYYERDEVVVELDYRELFSMPEDAKILVELLPLERTEPIVLQKHEVAPSSAAGCSEVKFSLAKLNPGMYEISAVFTRKGVCPMEKATFAHPAPPPSVVSPAKKVVPPIPAPPAPVDFDVDVSKGGGFTITVGGETFPFDSWLSWPHGEYNWLTAGRKPSHKTEKSWTVRTRKLSGTEFEVTAGGKFYTVERRILVHRDHVKVEDTFTNITNGDIGILIYNHLDAKGREFDRHFTGGYESTGRKDEEACPTVFGAKKGVGFGLLPLDDVFVVQSVLYTEPDFIGVGTEKFALAPKKSYTLEWAVYPNGTGDYFDFINAVRKNEDRIGTIDGGFAFISKGPFERRNIPTKEFVELRNIKYGCIHCLSGAADDPELSIEGIEFMDFPKEMDLLKEQFAAIHRKFPDLKVFFHVAHSLYATNKPDRFPDSKVIRTDGTQSVWEAGRYFSDQRQAEGWRWYIYYPTPGNSFHDAMMKSVDVMMDEIGADGVFMDGFFWGYRGRWTYDRWDGHSAEIDKKTKTIKEKMASVLLLSQPSLVQFSRKIRDKGGVVVANNSVLTRTICNEKYIIHDKEVHSGPFLQLAPSCTALANPSNIKSEKDIYRDALDKLKWGMLFFYYQEGDVTYESLPAKQFPMTFEEIRSGLVRGPERIVTMNPGVYGWRGDRRLHAVYRYDARGGRVAHNSFTTVDRNGVRTELKFKRYESAVVEKLPITLEVDTPVNLIVQQYHAKGITMVLNGKGEARLQIKTGTFEVKPGATFRIEGSSADSAKADARGVLSIPIILNGQTVVQIRKEA